MIKIYKAYISSNVPPWREWVDVVKAAEHEQVLKEKDDEILRVCRLVDEKNQQIAALKAKLNTLYIEMDTPIDDFTRNALDHCKHYENVADGEMLMVVTKLFEAVQIIKRQAEVIERLTKGLRNVLHQGHNGDCLFCGFKDKTAYDALKQEEGCTCKSPVTGNRGDGVVYCRLCGKDS